MRTSKTRKRTIRYGLLAINIVVLAAVSVFVIQTSGTQSIAKSSTLNTSTASDAPVSPLDELSSADIAAHVALLVKMDDALTVSNEADSINAQLATSLADDKVVAKPQVLNATAKTRRDIQRYVTVAGDTVGNLAVKFGVTSDSIRWSNNLTGDTLAAGKELWISPISDGVVYTVKSGDTAQSLAERFRANRDAIIAFNDAEVGGLPVGQRIVIPGGSISTARASGGGSGGFAWGGYTAIYGSNGYDPGYCTWYVANKRIGIGRPLPANLGNAYTWDDNARRAGILVNNTPKVGAAVVTQTSRSPGHVAYVEAVNSDGSVLLSEMNANWIRFQITSRTIPADQAGNYNYVH